MTTPFKLTLSIFVNNRIEPTPKNIATLMEKLNGLNKYLYLPNIIYVQNLDIAKGTTKKVANISFSTMEGESGIVCSDDRIDCAVNFESSALNDKLDFCVKALSIFTDEYDILGNRLAINIDLYSENSLKKFFNSNAFSSLFTFYKNHTLKDWSTTANTQFGVKIDKREETVNFNTLLKSIPESPTNKRSVLCHLDINTLPTNRGYRFSSSSLKSFAQNTFSHIEKLSTEFMEIKDEDISNT